jgi:peptide/nickel transport system permease protein
MVEPNITEERLEPPTVTMVLKSKQATKSVKMSLTNKAAIAGLIITVFYFLIGLLDLIYPGYLGVSGSMSNAVTTFHGNYSLTTPQGLFSGGWFLFGGTSYGLPVLPVAFAAVKFDLGFSLFVVLVGAGIGMVAGLYAGVSNGIIDKIISKFSDFFVQIPVIGLAVIIAAVLNLGYEGFAFALAITWWPLYAGRTRNMVRSTKKKMYIMSSVASGDSRTKIAFYHVFPNILPDIAIRIILDLGLVFELLATVDFLNIGGVNPYLPEIGNMMRWGNAYIGTGYWWPLVIPGIFIIGFGVGVYLLGTGLKSSLNRKKWRFER